MALTFAGLPRSGQTNSRAVAAAATMTTAASTLRARHQHRARRARRPPPPSRAHRDGRRPTDSPDGTGTSLAGTGAVPLDASLALTVRTGQSAGRFRADGRWARLHAVSSDYRRSGRRSVIHPARPSAV